MSEQLELPEMHSLSDEQCVSIDEFICHIALLSVRIQGDEQVTPAAHVLGLIKRVFGPFIERTDDEWQRILSDAIGRLTKKGLIRFEPEPNN